MKESLLLRFLDRYLGVAICFLLSFFKRRKAPSTPRKVLFIELFEMGAAVMAYPSLRYARDRFPEAELYCLTARDNRSSWEILGLLDKDRVLTVDGRSFFRFALSLLQVIMQLRRLELDLIIDFEKFTRIAAILSALAAPRRIAGFYRYEYEGLYRGSLLDIPCAFNQNAHIAKNFLALTKAALNNSTDYPNYKGEIASSELTLPHYRTDPALRQKIDQRLAACCGDGHNRRIVIVAPDVGANLSVRNYPTAQYAKVIDGLLCRYEDLLVLLVGTDEHAPTCRSLAAAVNHPRCINFCSQTDSVQELTELLSMAVLLISNDNGPAHFASLTACKVLALFSTDSPFVYGPLGRCVILYSFFHCSPCISVLNHKRTRCDNNLCLQALSPQRVQEFAARLLDDDPALQLRSINGELPYV